MAKELLIILEVLTMEAQRDHGNSFGTENMKNSKHLYFIIAAEEDFSVIIKRKSHIKYHEYN